MGKDKTMSIDDFAKGEDIDPSEHQEESQGLLANTLDGVVYIAEKLDRVTGAPLRSAVGAAQEGGNPATAFIDQFGRDTSSAPTGKDIVRKTGVFEKDSSAESLMGFVADLTIDPSVMVSGTAKISAKILNSFEPTAKLLKGAGDAVRIASKKKAAKSAFKAVAQNATTESVEAALKSKGDVVIGRALMDRGLGADLNNPSKLLDKIKGTQKYETVEAMGPNGVVDHFEKVATRAGDGIVSNISKQTDDLLEVAVREGNSDPIDVNALGEVLADSFRKKSIDPTTGLPWEPEYVEKYMELFNKHVIKTDPKVYKRSGDIVPGQFKVGTPNPAELGNFRSASDLQKLKRGIGKQISDAEFTAGIEPKDALKLKVLKDIYHSLNPLIEHSVRNVVAHSGKAGSEIPLSFLIKKNNADVSALMEASEMISKTRAKVLINNDTAQAIMATGASAATAASLVATGMMSPTTAALISGGAGAVVGAKGIAKVLPKLSAQSAEFLAQGKLLKTATKSAKLNTGARVIQRVGESNRERLRNRKKGKK